MSGPAGTPSPRPTLREIGALAARGRPPATRACLADDVARRTRAFETVVRDGAADLRFAVTVPRDRSARGVLLWVHGGGWVLGEAAEAPELRRLLADRTGLLVASVDYPLAPEHPFPAGLEAVERALRHLLRRRPRGCPLHVAGDSAGGNLATVAVRRCAQARQPVDGQILVYPITDHRLDRDSHRCHGGDGATLSVDDLRWFRELYLDGAARADHPDVAPIASEHLGVLPPTLLVLAESDPLRDEGLAYAEALGREGVPVECVVLDGEHGFVTEVGTHAAADEAVELMAGFVAAHPSGPPRPDLVETLFPPATDARRP